MSIETPSIRPKTGEEVITFDEKSTHIAFKQFWSWAYSDVLSNAIRGVFAEFLVMNALDIAMPCRREWDAYDLISNGGL